MDKPLRLIALLLLTVTTSAQAALIPLGPFTRDTATGLDWLDVNLTQGLSYEAVLAGAGDYTSDGWRYATGTEIDALALRYIGSEEQVYAGGLTLLRTLGVIAVLGPTFTRAYQDPDPSSPETIATLGFYYDGGSALRVGLGEFVVNFRNPIPGQPTFAGRWTTFDDFVLPNQSYFQIGSFLVREVPEPGTLALLGLGLAGLLVARRRRSAAPA